MNRDLAKNEFWKKDGVFERGLCCNYNKVITSYFLGSEFDSFIDKIYDDFEKKLEYSFWNDVAVDTKILVRDDEDDNWQNRYFAKYKDGKVYTYSQGNTSWSNGPKGILSWLYAKLYNENEED